MATWMSFRLQRIQMQNGYHRNRRPNRYQGCAISPKYLIKQLDFKFIFFLCQTLREVLPRKLEI